MPSTSGYDSLEVDTFLDKILEDYKFLERNEILLKEELEDLMKKITELTEDKKQLEIELSKYKSRFQNIKVSDNVTTENIELLKKINVYEKALYEKRIDPTKLKYKNFDLDDSWHLLEESPCSHRLRCL